MFFESPPKTPKAPPKPYDFDARKQTLHAIYAMAPGVPKERALTDFISEEQTLIAAIEGGEPSSPLLDSAKANLRAITYRTVSLVRTQLSFQSVQADLADLVDDMELGEEENTFNPG